jgi:hypothetical protein
MTALEFKEAMRKQVLTAPAPACMHDRRPRHWASTVDAFSHKSDASLFTRLHVDAFAHKIDAQQVLQSPHEVQRIKPRLSRAALLKSPKTLSYGACCAQGFVAPDELALNGQRSVARLARRLGAQGAVQRCITFTRARTHTHYAGLPLRSAQPVQHHLTGANRNQLEQRDERACSQKLRG